MNKRTEYLNKLREQLAGYKVDEHVLEIAMTVAEKVYDHTYAEGFTEGQVHVAQVQNQIYKAMGL